MQIARMEEVLSKHRKRASAELRTMMGEGVDETDEEKMKHQLVLDVNGLLLVMNELKLPVPESYGVLLKTVKSAYAKKKKKWGVCLHQLFFWFLCISLYNTMREEATKNGYSDTKVAAPPGFKL